jgi:hypothetical protein
LAVVELELFLQTIGKFAQMCNDDVTVIIEAQEDFTTVVIENDCEDVTIISSGLGANGLSAYDIAVANGFVGTEQEWLDSLKAVASLNDIDDVTITNVSNKQTLIYDVTTSLWKNGYSWQYLAINGKTDGIKNDITNGYYLSYTHQGNTIYRYITTATDANGYPNEDSFYATNTAGVLTNLIVTRG